MSRERRSPRAGAQGEPPTPHPLARAVPGVLAGAVVGLQIAYPLVEGATRDQLSIVTVLVFFAASVSHALVWRGLRWTVALVALTTGGGFAVEVLGVQTGWPFGTYTYADTLGATVAGVPLVIPLAWTMMAYPSFVVAARVTRAIPWVHASFGERQIARAWLVGALLGGWALASWDLFLDPQMVDAGHWSWQAGGPALVGIPLSNFAGWLLVAVVMMALLWRVVPRGAAEPDDGRGDQAPWPVTARRGELVPIALYLWVYASSLLAHLAFFGLPGAALAGGLGMGSVVVALGWALRRGTKPTP